MTLDLLLAAKKPAPVPTPPVLPEPAAGGPTLASFLSENPLILVVLGAVAALFLILLIRKLRAGSGLGVVAKILRWATIALLILWPITFVALVAESNEPLEFGGQLFVAAMILAPIGFYFLTRFLPVVTTRIMEQTRLPGVWYRWLLSRRASPDCARYLVSPSEVTRIAGGSYVVGTLHDPHTLATIGEERFTLLGRPPKALAGYWLVVDAKPILHPGGWPSLQARKRGLIARMDHQTVVSGTRCLVGERH
jgi:hypothetical protein